MLYRLVKFYAGLYGLVKDTCGWNLSGLGFALRLLKRDRVILVQGRRMFFSGSVAACYGRLVSGQWNEPETHRFLGYCVGVYPGTLAFIDVGASVGEMLVDVSRYQNVVKLIAFEPIGDCAAAIRQTLQVNDVTDYVVIQKVAFEKSCSLSFHVDIKNPMGSRLLAHTVGEENEGALTVLATTLDSELEALMVGARVEGAVLLVDVEGYEVEVLRGGAWFIHRYRPLIVFEYNHIGRARYDLSAVLDVVGDGWRIFRLNRLGRLDQHTNRA